MQPRAALHLGASRSFRTHKGATRDLLTPRARWCRSKASRASKQGYKRQAITGATEKAEAIAAAAKMTRARSIVSVLGESTVYPIRPLKTRGWTSCCLSVGLQNCDRFFRLASSFHMSAGNFLRSRYKIELRIISEMCTFNKNVTYFIEHFRLLVCFQYLFQNSVCNNLCVLT